MKDALSIITALYAHERMFDSKGFENGLMKTLASFYLNNKQQGFFAFADKIKRDRFLLEAVVNVLKLSDLLPALRQKDKMWVKREVTLDAARSHAIALIYGEAKPAVDEKEKIKALAKQLRSSKTIVDLRQSYTSISDEEKCAVALGTVTEKALKALVRRFDKSNSFDVEARKEVVISRLNDLGTGRVDPKPKTIKPLPNAAAKARWSGKEPE